MAAMNYSNFQLDDNATIQSLKILINQCWKTLPIFEGKNKENEIVILVKRHTRIIKNICVF